MHVAKGDRSRQVRLQLCIRAMFGELLHAIAFVHCGLLCNSIANQARMLDHHATQLEALTEKLVIARKKRERKKKVQYTTANERGLVTKNSMQINGLSNTTAIST